MAHGFFFLASLIWNFGLGMTWLALPLYAAAQGLSNAQIGLLIAVPVVAQMPLNLMGGAYTDRIGGRRIMLGSCVAMAAAALWLMFSSGFWMLILGQLGLILSRASFWPATWAMATELPGDRGTQLGRLNAVTNLGQISGTALCGLLLSSAGFSVSFAVLAFTGFAAFLAGLATPVQAARHFRPEVHMLAGYLPLVRKRIVRYSMLCAYVSALPFSLSVSFYPLLLAYYGHAEDASGVLLALRAVGAIGAGLIVARFVRTGPQTLWPFFCGVAVAAGVAFAPLVNHAAIIGFWMIVVGIGSAAMTIYFQVTISEASLPEERGSALALGGLGWSVSHFSTPLIMGFLSDRLGIVTGFYVIGALGLASALLIAWARAWAFEGAATKRP